MAEMLRPKKNKAKIKQLVFQILYCIMMRLKETLPLNNTATEQYKSSHASNERLDMNVHMVARVAMHPTVHPFMCNANSLT